MTLAYHNALTPEAFDPAFVLIEDYFNRKSLARLGASKVFDDFDCFEVEYLMFIEKELKELEKKENDKDRRSSRH